MLDIQPQILDEAKQVAIPQGSTQKEIDTIIWNTFNHHFKSIQVITEETRYELKRTGLFIY